jgi:transcriptional regulator with XRE-family HTH domain
MLGFGELLRVLRKRAGVTQTGLAQRVGVSQSYISRIEAGTRRPLGREVVVEMASALSLSGDQRDRLLLSVGYAPVRSTGFATEDATLSLVEDIINDSRVLPEEIELLRQYLRLLQTRRSGRDRSDHTA